MNYTIKYLQREPCFDTLGVMKLNCAAAVPVNDRIYAQAQLGRNDDSLFIRIISFEPRPAAETRLTAVLGCGERQLRLSVTADGQVQAQSGSEDLTDHLTAYITRGEDLQGEYWAGVLLFRLGALLTALGADQNALPLALSGNILREHPALSAAALPGETVHFILN